MTRFEVAITEIVPNTGIVNAALHNAREARCSRIEVTALIMRDSGVKHSGRTLRLDRCTGNHDQKHDDEARDRVHFSPAIAAITDSA